jgi:hypothetical protein
MLELRDLQSRFGLSEHQARRLLRALAPVLRGRVRRGRDNRLLLDDGACAIVERAVELWRSGIPLRDLWQSVAGEMRDPASHWPSGGELDQAKPPQDQCPLCQSRDALIAHLREENAWLRAKLDEALSRIPALPPAPARLSRWQALKIVILGRA